MKRYLIFFIMAVFSAFYLYSRETVTIVVKESPYYNLSAESDLRGIYRMIYEEAFALVGYDVEFINAPLLRGISMLFDNQADAHSPGALYITGELRKKIFWVPVGNIAPVYVYYKPSNVNANIPSRNMEDRIAFFRENRSVIALLSASPILDIFRKGGLDLILTENTAQQIRLVMAGRADMALSDYLLSMLTIRELEPEKADDFGFVFVPPWEISLAFSPGNPRAEELFVQFGRGLELLKSSGRYMEILETYWGEGNVPKIVLPDDLAPYGVDVLDTSIIP